MCVKLSNYHPRKRRNGHLHLQRNEEDVDMERRLLWELKCCGPHDTQLEAETTLTGLPEPPTEKEKGSCHLLSVCHYFLK